MSASAVLPAPEDVAADADSPRAGARPPVVFLVDEDASVRHFLSLILHGVGIDTEECADGTALAAALSHTPPDVIFLNVALEAADAIACVNMLAKHGYGGYVQLMSNRGAAVLAHVKSIGEQQRLSMLPPLKKPFDTAAVAKILHELKIGEPPAAAGRLELDEALANGWIEFWFQPKIDLRRKQLVGAEALARVRHPQYGVLMPNAFMPGASESSLIALAETALERSLQAGLSFAKLGVNLRLAVNIPVEALAKIDIADIVSTYRTQYEKWPGLIIDVAEEEILSDLALAHKLADKLAPINVKLAIDNCGRGAASLKRLKTMPFAELKLGRMFVTDCGTDRVNAPLCKSVIHLAHNFGSLAVAINIEKATDALALVSMGCDHGQGFLLGRPMPEERFLSLLRQRSAAQAAQTVPAAQGAEAAQAATAVHLAAAESAPEAKLTAASNPSS